MFGMFLRNIYSIVQAAFNSHSGENAIPSENATPISSYLQ